MGAGMIERFRSDEGRRLVAALSEHRLLSGIEGLSERLAVAGELIEVPAGESFIWQGDAATDVFFIVAGTADVLVNEKVVAIRHAGECVGEMAAIEPTQPRSATLTAREDCVLLKIPEAAFIGLADAFP